MTDSRTPALPSERPRWQRVLWMTGGVLSLLTGIVGIVVPLLPTVPLVLLAAFCFSRGSQRWEAWMLAHPRFGPVIVDWRANRAVPLRAKLLAIGMMTVSSVGAWWFIRAPWGYMPGLCCLLVAVWLWRLPTRAPRA